MARRGKALTLAVSAAAMCLLAFAAQDYVRGAAFVIQAAGMEGTVRTVAEWSTTELTESDVEIPWRDGSLRARAYRASSQAAPPTLLVPGVHAGGIDEPRLAQFARDLASTGRVVVTAELPDLKQYRITVRSTDMIEDAAVWLSSTSGYARDGRIGVIGISFAGGLAIVAAARPSIERDVAFAMSFGGHADLPRTLRYLCTGRLPDGSTMPPHDYGIAIILLNVAPRMVPPEQVRPLREAILAFLQASNVDLQDKSQAQIEFARAQELADSLPQPARTLMGYVNARDVATLGPMLLPHVAELGDDDALSPARWTPDFPVYLLHGTGDNVIPAAESQLLAESYRARGVDVTQLATPLITHAEVDRSAAVRAFWELVRFWAHLLDEA